MQKIKTLFKYIKVPMFWIIGILVAVWISIVILSSIGDMFSKIGKYMNAVKMHKIEKLQNANTIICDETLILKEFKIANNNYVIYIVDDNEIAISYAYCKPLEYNK